MIKKIASKLRDNVHSLYVGLFFVILFAMLVGIGTYAVARLAANYYIDNYYVSEQNRESRELDHIERLQKFITDNKLSSEDMAEISRWSKSNRYVYLMLYKDDQLFFTSDMVIPDKDETEEGDKDSDGAPDGGEGDSAGGETPDGEGSEGEGGDDSAQDGTQDGTQSGASGSQGSNQGGASGNQGENQGGTGGNQGGTGGNQGGTTVPGITIEYPTRDELMQYAQANDQHVIELEDGMLLASVAEYSEYFYYDISNIFSLVVAMILLAAIIISYFSRLIARIKRLEADVTIVSRGNMNHKIHARGYDEISRLSENVDNMRNSILENLRREREARDANTELITAMSHDIRTPLTVLLGYLEIMKSETGDSQLLGEYVAASERTAMRLKQLSDDMFKYSLAFGDATQGITLEEYDAAMLLDQMIAEHILLLRESGYNPTVEYKGDGVPEGATVMTDAQNLMRIVDNVFSNLHKYADKDEPIRISVIVEGDTVIFECRNTETKDKTRVESNGIGLKTCSRLAELVSDGFEYGLEGGTFTTRLRLKINVKQNEERGRR